MILSNLIKICLIVYLCLILIKLTKKKKMKKITMLNFAFVAITFASCKKDRVCTCTTDSGFGTPSTSKVTYLDASKKGATANCLSSTSTFGTLTYKTTCALD